VGKFHITGEEVAELFARTKPRIAIGGRTEGDVTSLSITTGQMQPGNDKVVAQRIVAVLSEKRPPRSESMPAPSGSVAGQWDVTMEFFAGASTHHFTLEQDGNWIQGKHQSDFAINELVGMIEGHEIKLRSNYRAPGDGITYLFSGVLTDAEFSGSVYMGEYLTAKFKARKRVYKPARKRIVIPGGPPLAT
jgi:D-glucosaminate-6-phosphate ammonia-lyase